MMGCFRRNYWSLLFFNDPHRIIDRPCIAWHEQPVAALTLESAASARAIGSHCTAKSTNSNSDQPCLFMGLDCDELFPHQTFYREHVPGI